MHLIVVAIEIASAVLKIAIIFGWEWGDRDILTRAYILYGVIAMDVIICSVWHPLTKDWCVNHGNMGVAIAIAGWTISVCLCPIFFIIVNIQDHAAMAIFALSVVYLVLSVIVILTFLVMDIANWHIGPMAVWGTLCMLPLIYGMKTINIWWIVYGGVSLCALLVAWFIHLLWPGLGWRAQMNVVV